MMLGCWPVVPPTEKFHRLLGAHSGPLRRTKYDVQRKVKGRRVVAASLSNAGLDRTGDSRKFDMVIF